MFYTSSLQLSLLLVSHNILSTTCQDNITVFYSIIPNHLAQQDFAATNYVPYSINLKYQENMSIPAYNEDVIADLMNQIFDLHIQLCYFRAGDLVFPELTSSGDNTFDRPRHVFSPEDYEGFSTLSLSPRVISLLERLPYLSPEKDGRSFPFYQWGSELVTSTGGNIADTRNPHLDMEYPMLPSDMAIVTTFVVDAYTVILDTDAS